MKHISSRENPLYKQIARLLAGKHDDDPQDNARVALEGIHVCQAWLQYAGPPDMAVFDIERLDSVAELAALAGAVPHRVRVTCEPRLMSRLSQVHSDQGVIFIVSTPAPAVPQQLVHNGLWLDRVQDPGNLGTLLRTAAAAGIRHAYLSQGCASAWSQKVLRSAQGAHFAMEIYEHLDLSALCDKLAVPLIATALEHAQSLYSKALPKTCVWLFGNEGRGVDQGLLQRADARVFIPQTQGVESLNVAAAAAICLFEQRRQHHLL